MIPGEFEHRIQQTGHTWDTFFSKKPESELSPEQRQRREKRQEFWQKVGQQYNNAGGAQGIGRTVDNVMGMFGGIGKRNPTTPPTTESPINARIGVDPATDEEESKSKIWLWGLVGLLVVGGIVCVLVMNSGEKDIAESATE